MSLTPSNIPQLLPAAEAGDGQAQFRLAVLYRNEGNLMEAQKWARISAWAGVVEAQLLLAAFLGGEKPKSGTSHSTRELWRAALLYHRAMEQGSETGKSRLRELLEGLAEEWRDFGEDEDEGEAPDVQSRSETEIASSGSTELGWNFEMDYLSGTPWRIDSSVAAPGGATELVLSFRPSQSVPCPLCDCPGQESSVSRFQWCLEEYPYHNRTDAWIEGDRQWETSNSRVVVVGNLPHFHCPTHGTFPAPMPWTRNKRFFALA